MLFSIINAAATETLQEQYDKNKADIAKTSTFGEGQVLFESIELNKDTSKNPTDFKLIYAKEEDKKEPTTLGLTNDKTAFASSIGEGIKYTFEKLLGLKLTDEAKVSGKDLKPLVSSLKIAPQEYKDAINDLIDDDTDYDNNFETSTLKTDKKLHPFILPALLAKTKLEEGTCYFTFKVDNKEFKTDLFTFKKKDDVYEIVAKGKSISLFMIILIVVIAIVAVTMISVGIYFMTTGKKSEEKEAETVKV